MELICEFCKEEITDAQLTDCTTFSQYDWSYHEDCWKAKLVADRLSPSPTIDDFIKIANELE